ncbi:hypothetical protein P9314_12020 [Paenibacillus validus]|uniref:Uncharacterized protein n=1 Tax=Paenibacillus validus TaxID=44253 RepID=A0A7X3CSE6_9BACL|nr:MULTISPECIES: hypothetical protein [Paenibacillus]MED4601429.1 hypothetical protein [Paenibacillus validus]MED4607778.1 hypothetical protein [Paenibacillus validus]MUG71695.1 hypothetical protein [Paenibacillus validus]
MQDAVHAKKPAIAAGFFYRLKIVHFDFEIMIVAANALFETRIDFPFFFTASQNKFLAAQIAANNDFNTRI